MENELLSDAPTPVIDVSGLRVVLGGIPIIEGADFRVGAGEVVVLTGSNGAGKSTLLRALVGLIPTADGEVRFLGHRPRSMEARKSFAYAPDDAVLYEDLTLREHARVTVMLYDAVEREERILGWIDAFGLGDRLDEYPGTHSRGMRQKLALSLALGLGRPALLLDEPFNALDLEAQDLLAEALLGYAAEGKAVFLTGHQAGLVERLGGTQLRVVNGAVREGDLATVD